MSNKRNIFNKDRADKMKLTKLQPKIRDLFSADQTYFQLEK